MNSFQEKLIAWVNYETDVRPVSPDAINDEMGIYILLGAMGGIRRACLETVYAVPDVSTEEGAGQLEACFSLLDNASQRNQELLSEFGHLTIDWPVPGMTIPIAEFVMRMNAEKDGFMQEPQVH